MERPDHLRLHRPDGSLKPIVPEFLADEELFRGFTLVDMENPSQPMPGLSFGFDPHCSLIRGLLGKWNDILVDRPTRGVFAFEVRHVPPRVDDEELPCEPRLIHTPDEILEIYPHAEIMLHEHFEDAREKLQRRIRKLFRTQLNDNIERDTPPNDKMAWTSRVRKWPEDREGVEIRPATQ